MAQGNDNRYGAGGTTGTKPSGQSTSQTSNQGNSTRGNGRIKGS